MNPITDYHNVEGTWKSPKFGSLLPHVVVYTLRPKPSEGCTQIPITRKAIAKVEMENDINLQMWFFCSSYDMKITGGCLNGE